VLCEVCDEARAIYRVAGMGYCGPCYRAEGFAAAPATAPAGAGPAADSGGGGNAASPRRVEVQERRVEAQAVLRKPKVLAPFRAKDKPSAKDKLLRKRKPKREVVATGTPHRLNHGACRDPFDRGCTRPARKRSLCVACYATAYKRGCLDSVAAPESGRGPGKGAQPWRRGPPKGARYGNARPRRSTPAVAANAEER
jgi:hypothetical protein